MEQYAVLLATVQDSAGSIAQLVKLPLESHKMGADCL